MWESLLSFLLLEKEIKVFVFYIQQGFGGLNGQYCNPTRTCTIAAPWL